MTPFQQALSSVSPEEARAIFDALDQMTVNNEEPLELAREAVELGTNELSEAELEHLESVQEAGLEVLDRMNTELAGMAV